MTLALVTELPALILMGFLIVGFGLAIAVPIGFSLAGDLAPGRAGEATSAITVLGYGGFLIGPALIGALAEWLGLRLALATVIAAGAFIMLLGSRVRTAPQGAGLRLRRAGRLRMAYPVQSGEAGERGAGCVGSAPPW